MPFDGVAKTYRGFCVAKNDLKRWRWRVDDPPRAKALLPGQVLVAVDQFAFTTNNVTYARLGDQIAYWRFFPAPAGWGYIPVWGLGNVLHSRHPEVSEGERIYGYFPMATHLMLLPGGLRGARLIDGAEHRKDLPQTYNEYLLVDRDANYDRAHTSEHLVLRPLFSLSFFCAEFLREERYFGARQLLISSASSKTALGLAFLLAQVRCELIEIVGLTSAANLSFVENCGTYDRVIHYGAITSLPAEPSVFIDIAGDGAVRAAVHTHLEGLLQHSARIGFTHWDQPGAAETCLPGPSPKLFFTPDHILQRRREWGAEALGARLAEAWQSFLGYVKPWLVIEHTAGAAGVERVYHEVLGGRTPPERANVLSIAEP